MSDQAPAPTTPPASPPKRSHHAPLTANTSLDDAFSHPRFLEQLKLAVPKHLTSDRMLSVMIQSVRKTPKLRDVNVLSLLGAFVSVASVGLEPNTALQHAFLIPFDKSQYNSRTKQYEVIRTDVNVIFGYQGLLELAYRSGLLRSVHADVVWAGDDFEFWYGTDGQLKHRPKGAAREPGARPTHAYMHANLKGGGESYEVMPISEVLAIRDQTQAYKAALAAKKAAESKGWAKVPASYTESPWVKYEVPMMRKTVFRAGQKWLPKSIELAAALTLDEQSDSRRVNFAGVIDGSADVLTGLEALPDEMADRMDGGLSGEFSGYSMTGDRSGEKEPAQTQEQTQEQVSDRPRQEAKPPAFSAELVDAEGEIASDALTSPAVFAEAFLRQWGNTPGDQRETLLDNNWDALQAASKFPAAAELLQAVIADATERLKAGGAQGAEQATMDAGQPDLAAEIPLPIAARGQSSTAAWIKLARPIVATIDAGLMPEWVMNNQATYRAFSASERLEVEKMVADRCRALGIKPPSFDANIPGGGK